MIKRIILLLLPFMAMANNPQVNELRDLVLKINSMPDQLIKLGSGGVVLKNEIEVLNWLNKTYPESLNEQIQFKLDNKQESIFGTHYHFVQIAGNTPLYKGYIRVNTTKSGNVFLLNVHLFPATNYVNSTIQGKPDACVLLNGQFIALYKNNETWNDVNGNIIQSNEHKLYLQTEDTMVTGKVFNHDPLTSQNVIYGQGGTYKHFNDSNYELLNGQRVSVSFPATYENGKFILKNQYAVIQDILAPNSTIPSETQPVFDYLRSDTRFKEVMAYYHVLHTRDYFTSLGLTGKMNYQQRIDALSGTLDNSYFDMEDSTLNFGVGGLPDAEDADVCVHEFTHALSFSINPAPNMGVSERRTVEEAMCDVVAAVQSYKVSTFNWRKLYNFDGPNPVASGATSFWGGRTGESYKTYDNKMNNPYQDCEIWSTTLLDIAEHQSVGHDTLVKLMLNSINLMTEQTTIKQAAQLLLDADSLLNNGAHKLVIGYYFNQRKLGVFPDNVNELNSLPNWFSIYNSEGFAKGEGMLQIHSSLSGNFTVELIDINGKVILSKTSTENIKISPDNISSGVYYIRIGDEGRNYPYKVIRY